MTNPNGGAGPLLMEALSERMLRHADVDTWRAIFLGPAQADIRFETMRCTVLASDSPLEHMSADEGALLASRLGGELQPSTDAELVLCFRTPTAALRAALVLQRLSTGRSVRTSLTSVTGPVAMVQLEDGLRRLLVGAGLDRAEGSVAHAVPGTILLCGETHNALGDTITHHVRDGLVATELDEETVTRASITLPPHASSDASTFAGLGRF